MVLCLSLRHNTLVNKQQRGGSLDDYLLSCKSWKKWPPQPNRDWLPAGTYVLTLVFELLLRMCLEYVHSIFCSRMVRFWSQRWRVGFWIYYLLRVVLFFGEVESVFLSLKCLSSFVWRTSELRWSYFHVFVCLQNFQQLQNKKNEKDFDDHCLVFLDQRFPFLLLFCWMDTTCLMLLA